MYETPKALSEWQQDEWSFMQWLLSENDREDEDRDYMKELLRTALQEEVTPTQLTYIIAYYVEKLSMPEIADRYGVNRSTVSRTINRGMIRIKKVMRYCSPQLLKASIGEERISIPRASNRNKKYRIRRKRRAKDV